MKKHNRCIQTVTTFLLLISIFCSWPGASFAAEKVQLDVLYMNHGPMRPTVAKVKALVKDFGDRVQAAWYDFDQPSGKAFMAEKKIVGHVPMLIMINGKSDFTLGQRDVKLQGFPTGAGPFKRVEGNWSLEDLKLLLEQHLR